MKKFYYTQHRNTNGHKRILWATIANQMDNLKEIYTFSEKYNLLKLSKEKIENLNGPIISMEIKTVFKNLPTKKSPG